MNTLELRCLHLNIRLTIGEDKAKEFNIKGNKEGYFELIEPLIFDPSSINAASITVELPAQKSNHGRLSTYHVSREATLFFKNYPYGVISDIDDTILITGVISRLKWRLLYNSFFVGPYQRQSFGDTAAFYKRLINISGAKLPLFYISNSPWNFFDYLQSFLNHNNFPKGIMLLRDLKIARPAKQIIKMTKYREIARTIKSFEHLSFYLIGDAAEWDADIYLAIAGDFPGRIKAIFIRTTNNAQKNTRVRSFFASEREVPCVLFDKIEELSDKTLSAY